MEESLNTKEQNERLSLLYYLHYQPIVQRGTLPNERYREFEVLLRKHSTKKFPYFDFQNYTSNEEENEAFLNWFSYKLLEKIKANSEVTFSINIDPIQWNYKATYDFVESLQPYASQIIIELTEHKSKHDYNIKKVILFLKSKDFCVALDDITQGVNCLNLFVLNARQIDRIKFSLNSFDNKSKNYVKKIISIAHQYNTKIVIEQVEDKEIEEYLFGYQADFLQGYLYSSEKSPLARKD